MMPFTRTLEHAEIWSARPNDWAAFHSHMDALNRLVNQGFRPIIFLLSRRLPR